ncbi:MAG: prenyltransferase, partial [Methylococcales bacterium]
SEKGTRNLGFTFLTTAALLGIYLWTSVGTGVLVFGIAGALAGFFYTAPPVRLAARHGLGELAIAVTFGPLITGGIFYVITGEYSWMALLVGLPVGLLTANILLINEVPDAESDASTGKNHLVVTFGKEKSILIYSLIVAAAVASSVILAFQLENMWLLLPAILGGISAIPIVQTFRRNLHSRELVSANVNTIYFANCFGILFLICLLM